MKHGERMAVTVGRQPPIVGVLHHPDDESFSILFSDAPDDGRELTPGDERFGVACLCCLIDRFPEVGRGLDLALANGEAAWNPATGKWWDG